MNFKRSQDHVKDVRTALLVLGMHRGGTSAFTRVINLLGADLPTTLLVSTHSSNPLGFWESTELVALHDEILASAGTTWHDWTRFDPGWYESPLAMRFRERLLAYLVQDFGASTLFVVKDPRMCRLVRLWRETCEEFGARIKVVIPIRNPMEVAQSLGRREGFTPAKCHLVWLRHTLGAIQDTKGLARCVVSYDALLRDWRETAATISRRLQVNWRRYSPSMEAEIDAFLGHEERHHVVDDDAVLEDPALSEWIKRAYRTLLTMTGSDDSPSAQADLDDLIHQFDEASPLFNPLLKEQERALIAAGENLGTVRTRLGEIDGRARALEGQLQQVTAELTEVRRHLDQAGEEKRQWEEQAQARLGEALQRLAGTERRLALGQQHTRALSRELTALRHRPALRVLGRFRPGSDLSQQIDPTFQNLLDDSYLLLGGVTGYRLQPSDDLQTLGGLTYSLRLDRPNLSGLMLAPIVDLSDESGSLGIALSSPDGSPVARVRVSLAEIEHHGPVRFVFPPVPSSVRHVVLQVDVRDATTPVRLFEWRKHRLFGLGRLATRPFCAFLFD